MVILTSPAFVFGVFFFPPPGFPMFARSRVCQSSVACLAADLWERSRLGFIPGETADYEPGDKPVTSILGSADPDPAGEHFAVFDLRGID